MQSITIDERANIIQHKIQGDAFAFDSKTKYALCGGELFTEIIDINNIDKICKQIPIKTPKKWFVSSYEWDVYNSHRFLQNRNKISELVDIETSNTILKFEGHSGLINESKFNPIKPNVFLTSSIDSHIYLWNTEQEKPSKIIHSIGGADSLAWSKLQENLFAVTYGTDIKIYDIRKTSSAVRYMTNAHSKKIYSIDWCSTENKLLTCSRDKNIRLWPLNSNEQKFIQIKLDEFQCWKAKFLPYGVCFAVMPSCPSINTEKNNFLTNFYKPMSPSINNINLITQNKSNDSNLHICQVNSLQQAKVYRYVSNHFGMILNFDFNFSEDEASFVAWTKSRYLINCKLDPQHLPQKDSLRLMDETSDIQLKLSNLLVQQSSINPQQHQSITSTSSRKSSFSEGATYGTSPNTIINVAQASINLGFNVTSINSSEENTPITGQTTQSVQTNLPISKSFTRLVDTVPYPKLFGAKFSGLPNHMIIYKNNSNTNQFKSYPRVFSMIQSDKIYDRLRNKKIIGKQSKFRQNKTSKKIGHVHIIDISNLISIKYDLASKYLIIDTNLQSISEQNYNVALKESRGDIAKIWELLKYITKIDYKGNSLNPDHGRPWASSSFGRSLLNYIVETCMQTNDIQTIAMILSEASQHDSNTAPIACTLTRRSYRESMNTDNFLSTSRRISSVNTVSTNDATPIVGSSLNDEVHQHQFNFCLLDPYRSNEFDYMIKFYSDILYRWGLHTRRAELYQFINEKPLNLDEKFKCPSRCPKCNKETQSPKCTNSECTQVYNLYCSLCTLPVIGLSCVCFACSHGGHYEHMLDWFRKHDECAAACGCKCTDYL